MASRTSRIQDWKISLLAIIIAVAGGAVTTYVSLGKTDTAHEMQIEQLKKDIIQSKELANLQFGNIQKILDGQDAAGIQRQKTLNILTVRSTRMEEQRDAQTEAFREMTAAINALSASQGQVAIALEGLGVRVAGVERDIVRVENMMVP